MHRGQAVNIAAERAGSWGKPTRHAFVITFRMIWSISRWKRSRKLPTRHGPNLKDGKPVASNIQAMMNDPAAFRRHLLIDTDTSARPLDSCLDPWQRADFEALDVGWRRAMGQDV